MKYRIYPTLLDAFTHYLDSEASYERFFGNTEEPSKSLAEYEKECFEELIDKINRVPFVSEAADRGSCFNEIVDCIVLHKPSTRNGIKVSCRQELVLSKADGLIDPCDGKVVGGDVEEEVLPLPHIEAEINGSIFRFEIPFCKSAAEYFKDSLAQVYTQASLATEYGEVQLYGYIDYLRRDMVYDAKTTKKYEFGKYAKFWQQHVYPYCLIESGKCTGIRAFEFSSFQLKGGTARQPLITGVMYPEVYVYDHERSTLLLRSICERFIEFLENNRPLITDKKIFGGENE